MPRPTRPGPAHRDPRRVRFIAVSERKTTDGGREVLQFTPDAVRLVRERDGRQVREEIPLKELERVRTRERVGRVELLVALSYLLGASLFLYLIVNLVGRLDDASTLLVLGVLTFFAAGGVAAAWFGREAVVQFTGRGRRKRIEYTLQESERERLQVIDSFADLQKMH